MMRYRDDVLYAIRIMDILYSIGIAVCNGKVAARVTRLFVEVIGELELRPQFRGPFAGCERGAEAGQEVVTLVEDQDGGLYHGLSVCRTEAEFAIRMVAHHLDIESDQVDVGIVGTDGVEGGIPIAYRVVGTYLGEDWVAAGRLGLLVGTQVLLQLAGAGRGREHDVEGVALGIERIAGRLKLPLYPDGKLPEAQIDIFPAGKRLIDLFLDQSVGMDEGTFAYFASIFNDAAGDLLYINSSQGFHVSPVVNGTVRHRLFAQPEGDGVQLLQPFIVYFFVHGDI